MKREYPIWLPKKGTPLYRQFRLFLKEKYHVGIAMRLTTYKPDFIQESWIEFQTLKK